MNFFEKMRKGFNAFEDLLFTECSCICCTKEIDNSNKFLLCEKCESELIKIEKPTCYKCGGLLAYRGERCEGCMTINYMFNKNISFYVYNDVSAKIIKNLKYSNKMTISKYIARLMTENLSVYKGVDYLSFVPISNSGLKMREYNQAEEIAREIGKITGIKVVGLLDKDDGNKRQAELGRIDRINNLKDCFHLKENFVIDNNLESESGKIFEGKVIMLIDDVFTTGTTLSRCSQEIKKLKPKTIKTVTFAKTCIIN